jgi:hypothetical protein
MGKGASRCTDPRLELVGHGEPVIGRAFARPVGFAHPHWHDFAFSRQAGRGEIATDLGYSESELFFQAGLDDPNQFEFSQEIRVYVAPNAGLAHPCCRGRLRLVDTCDASGILLSEGF